MLFRREVLESRQREWLGSIQLIRPPSLAWLTFLAIGAAGVVAIYLTLGEYTRKARVTGYLVPDHGVLRLMAPQVATVVENQAGEGRAVRRGDVLFVLSVGQATLSGDTQAAVQASLTERKRSLEESAAQKDLGAPPETSFISVEVRTVGHCLAAIAFEAALTERVCAIKS